MDAVRKYRIPAVGCAITFLFCELICNPTAEMGICDDWSYFRTAQILAQTGHIAYNGWATALLGWQLYLAALMMKLLGQSFTTARMSTLLVGAVTAFLIQRVFVRVGVSERNATVGTLALVLSPLYMMLSVTFMTDIQGLFALVICLYGCLRAIQSETTKAAISWLCFASLTNAVVGTSRQIAWLGVLVIVPCTLWLLRDRRRVMLPGIIVTCASGAFIAGCMHWFQQQPYSLPESILIKITSLHQVFYVARQLVRGAMEVPFLVLAILLAFVPEIRNRGKRLILAIAVVGVGYTLLAVHLARHYGPGMMLQPLLGDWIGQQGHYAGIGSGPVVLGVGIRAVLTALSIVGLICAIAVVLRLPKPVAGRKVPVPDRSLSRISWNQIAILLGPFTLVYFMLLIPRAMTNLLDRYLLSFAFVAALFLVRAYQDFVHPTLPAATSVAVVFIALFSIGATHDMFAMSRARIAIAKELQMAGVADNTVDGGFEYNGWVELEHGGHINDPRLINPPNAFIAVAKYRGLTCTPKKETDPGLLHFMPQFGIAFEPNACRGAAPFAPVSYFRWLGMRSTSLYVVKYGPV